MTRVDGSLAAIGLRLPPTWLYAGRTTAAALLALYVAYFLQLDSPYSASVTAVIVANPMHGMVWSKSLYRLAGTLAGALAALVLMGAFSQAPELFVLGLGIWMGLCTAAATLLRNFRSYGAVLAGYTVVLVAIPAVDDPLSIFTRVLDRGSVVVVGLICSALVSALFSPRTAESSLRVKLCDVLADLARFCALALDPEEDGRRITALRPRVGLGIHGLNNLIEFAATERPELARLADTLGVSINGMLGTMSAATSVHAALRSPDAAASRELRLAAMIEEARALLDRLVEALAGRNYLALERDIGDLRTAFGKLDEKVNLNLPAAETQELAALDRLDDMLMELGVGIDGLLRLLRRDISDFGVRAQFHRDWRGALINGTRAAIALWLVCALWIASAWPNGGTMVLAIVPAVGLFATRDTPASDATDFASGMIAATFLAVIFLVGVLPPITGFAGLACVLAPIIFVGTLIGTSPKWVFFGVGFSVFFITELAPSNPMTYDIVGTLNNGAAFIIGGVLTALVYRIVLPVNPRGRIRSMVRIIISDLAALARLHQRPYSREAWESRMHDRLVRLRALLQLSGLAQENIMHGSFAAFRLGREILRTRAILDASPALHAAAAAANGALTALEHVQHDPVLAAGSCREAAASLRRLATDHPTSPRAACNRAAASFLEMATLIDHHHRFFQWAAA